MQLINTLKNKTNMNLNGENYILEVRILIYTVLKKYVQNRRECTWHS